MNPIFQRLMQTSAALGRPGQLRAATELIQKNLREAGWPSAAHGAQAASPAFDDAAVIDVAARVIQDDLPDVAPPAMPDSVRDVEGPRPERWSQGEFNHQGRNLAFRLYEPPEAAGGVAAPRALLLMLHGCTQDAADFAAGTRMNALARAHGMLVLYPEQTAHAHSQKCWNWFKPQHQQRGRGEPALLAALTQSIMAKHQVDRSRVYVAGLSAGGAMADIMGRCYPDLFAAVGVHSGLPRGAAKDLVSALAAMRSGGMVADAGSASPPVIVFHGDADSTVHPANGIALVQAARQGQTTPAAPSGTEKGASSQGRGFTRQRYRNADGITAVEHWQLHGAGHAWAGGSAQGSYTDPNGVDASAEMLRFFMEHRLSR